MALGYLSTNLLDKLRRMEMLTFVLLLMCLLAYGDSEPKGKTKENEAEFNQTPTRVCRGTNTGFNHNEILQQRYNTYKARYTNCTYVDGNLEIVFLEGASFNLTFLEDIREVTGYVLIASVYSDYIPLTNLRVIRGREQFHWNEQYYSLWVGLNYRPDEKGGGLKELRFTSLYEISKGDVFFHNNHQLCFENTINWGDILSGEGARYHHHSDDHVTDRRKCGECDASCMNEDGDAHCWGEGPDMCQKLTKETCSPQCEGRCYGPQPNQCCNPECVGGCTGPTSSDCWACQNVRNEGKCERFCPPEKIYDPTKYKYVDNPKAKYTYGTLCVNECPPHLLADNGACVSSCGADRMAGPDRKCTLCDGPCPKTCAGIGKDFVHKDNIKNFTDCTIIDGSIRILQSTFTGDAHRNISVMHPDELSVFQKVREITGFLQIQSQHEQFINLSYFSNLQTIHGRELDSTGSSFQIYQTKLKYLELTSLRPGSIKNGMIFIAQNSDLCFVDTIDWRSFLASPEGGRAIETQNKNMDSCKAEDRYCDPQCSEQGCWGIGNNQCLSCANYFWEDICMETCEPELNIYRAGDRECKSCHEQCRGKCSGGGAAQCDQCKNVKDGPYCVDKCPQEKYADENGVCQPCHENCEGGCSGPKNTIGEGACHACKIAVLDVEGNVTSCLARDKLDCGEGYFKTVQEGQQVCKLCHPECKTCNGDGLQFCQTCLHYSMEGKCVANCTTSYFADDKKGQCVSCDSRCVTCRGPTMSDCLRCRHFKVYLNYNNREEDQRFNCTDKCPPAYPARIHDETKSGDTDMVCVTEAVFSKSVGKGKNYVPLIIGLVVGGVVIVAIVITVIFYFRRQWARAEENKLRLTARMSGLEESEPLTPTDAKPDMSCLRLIKESELRKGNIIGSGAFGTVFKGVWIPEGENVKIPVAIKVLQEGTSPNQNKELLEEARIMASVEHPCCIRILAVCMTAQMMLITQLMPLGCLLDYVRKNRSNIGSKVLLNWCTQIAKGMWYLEERAIVHRDLAARNVLVQSPGQVKITDFGLAKLLDFRESEFHASGGKMPIKWLALECIQHRVFTHKSDVWSFGVTIWELFTFGQRPYDVMRARDIPDLLEKGERLSQPSICTIDVYMIMIKCWMLDANSRPSFKELADEFAKMARDPGRYLVIQGDKLLRLPSHSYDTHDLVRDMNVKMEGPEKIMDAEEYLQPQQAVGATPHGPVPQPIQMNGKLDKVGFVNPHSQARLSRNVPHQITEDSGYDNDQQMSGASRETSLDRDDSSGGGSGAAAGGPRREKKYSGLESAMEAKNKRVAERENTRPPRDSVSSRYSSDPCRVLGVPGQEDFDGPDMPAPPTPVPIAEEGLPPTYGAKMKMPIPVDEDDYLQPKSTNPAAYMDLVQDAQDYLAADGDGLDSSVPPTQQQYLDMSPGPPPSAIDNPEYYDSARSPRPPFGHHTNSDKQPLTLQPNGEDSSVINNVEPRARNQDYYNEFDQMKQPVKYGTRTESSV